MHVEDLARHLPALFCALLVSLLFLQSGLDKVFDWKGNLGWLTGHFEKTFVGGIVPMMLGTITAMELGTGFLAAAGIIYFFAAGSSGVMFWAGAFGAASISALFFGQRIAKDYPGAAVLVPYFILMIVLMLLANPYAAAR
jgi:hypothetical protein